ncbi:MAG: hypothetical protein QOK05_1598 [Chloroflexota bacterium]|nr:hypothetical protein [Chloroflexota bacterium]
MADASPAGALTLVGSSPLRNRGMNAALAVADHCAYIGSRNEAGPLIVDIANPAQPSVVGELPAHAGSTPRELRAVATQHLVIVLFYRLGGGYNGYDIYRWGADCTALTRVGSYDMGASAPHEFYLWQDPSSPGRVLLFTTMFGASGEGLQVIDISDPAHPNHVGGWSVPSGYGHAPVHSISISPDAMVAYVSLWTGGLVVADVSDFTSGRTRPVFRPLTPPAAVYKTPPGNVHSAVPLAGGTRVVTTDERYPTPFGAGCPYGAAHVVDVSNPARPVAVSAITVLENNPSTCASAPKGTYTSHNVTVTANLALISWYSAGLVVVGLDDVAQPVVLAEQRPSGISPQARDLELGTTDTMTWSYPVILGGLVYVVDINQGLLVLRYTGPHEDEVKTTAFAEGNSNLATASAAVATPAAIASAPATPAPIVSPSPGLANGSGPPWTTAGAVTVAILALALAALAYRSWRSGVHRPHSNL